MALVIIFVFPFRFLGFLHDTNPKLHTYICRIRYIMLNHGRGRIKQGGGKPSKKEGGKKAKPEHFGYFKTNAT
jgi:hypothetical protein